MQVLEFRSNNDSHKPLIDALQLITSYMEESSPYFPEDETIPLDDVVLKQWHSWVFQKDSEGKRRVRRVRYELCVLQTLAQRLRCREIWVVGSDQYRNPDEDVPADFNEKRELYLAALNLPTDGEAFVTTVKTALTAALRQFNETVPTNPHVSILARGNGWIKLSPLRKQTTPRQLRRLKQHIKKQW